MRRLAMLLLVAGCALLPQMTSAQSSTGTLIGSVKDEQGGVLAGACGRVRARPG